MTTLSEWVPGLDGNRTLGAAHDEMPGDDASIVPWYVRLLENPTSPISLPGAIDLFGHDCAHIVLGRGTLPADEAFVLGMTMGSTGRLARWHQRLFSLAARNIYRGPWRLSDRDGLLFDMAVEFARHQRITPLNEVPWRRLRDRPLCEIRESLGIRVPELITFFKTEQVIWPDSAAARRLPTAAHTHE